MTTSPPSPHRPGVAHLGIDLGGTKTEVAVLDAQHQVVWRHRVPTPAQDYDAIVDTVQQLVTLARAHCTLPATTPVGVGMPGCLDPHTQRVRGANTQVLNGRALQDDLQRALGVPVRLANDANCLALSEAVDGAARGARLVFAAILGTGCGGGLAWEQQVWVGPHALAGEWGHNPLPWPTPQELAIAPCWCGQRGCLETWLSGPALAADHARVSGQPWSAPEVVAQAQAGHPDALATLDRYQDRLARALAQVVNLLDPEVIVLGGGLSQIDALYEGLGARLSRHTFHRPVHTPVRRALHGDASGVRGAAWLFGA